MNYMVELINIQFLERFLGSSYFLFALFTTFFLLKTYILYNLINKNALNSNFRRSLFLLIVVIASTLFSDSAWILKTTRDLFFSFDAYIYALWVRICWSTIPIQYLALSLFIDSISSQSLVGFSNRQKTYIVLNLTCTFFIMVTAIINFNYPFTSTPNLNFLSQKVIGLYVLFIVILPSIYFCIQKIRNNELPHILSKQLTLLISFVIIPWWLADFLQIYPFNFSENWVTNSYTFVSLANILLTYAVYYCSRKIIGLRFLNFDSHVKAPAKFNFMNNFREILERFSQVTKIQELSHITRGFFKEIFTIPLNRTTLHIRNTNFSPHDTESNDTDRQAEIVETFMSTHEDTLCLFIKNNKILIYDEIAFSHFYEESASTKNILTFLEAINADIFIPVYEKGKMIAYIIVDRHARLHEFYSDLERDEMIVFASYLGNLINLLQTRSLDVMIHEEKELQEELYRKHQEINQYKESIRSFLRANKQKQIGIIFYKNRRFTFGNQAATDLIGFNLNNQEGHPLARAIKTLAQQVETYGTPQTQFAKDNNANTIVLAGVPHLEKNNSIVLVYYPEISDIIKQQIDLLKDPSERDYLLYLETTKSGQLINDLIPGSGEILLNFKIELLKTALNKKALLLDLPDEDLLPTVELLHHISVRKHLHVLTLSAPVKDFSIATQLFGINPIFGGDIKEQPLIQKLNDTGTLFIKNIHLLDLETQHYLAEFIRYGYYRIFKSEQKEVSNVRIICSSNQNLHAMAQSGTFLPALFNEISRTHISMPSLLTLPEDELRTLAQGYSEQAIKTQTFKNLLNLTDKDKDRIASNRPASLQELKSQVQQVLLHKSKQTNIDQEAEFDPAFQLSDPDIIKASRLGKHALKDLRIMTMLWNKFNNQNKIASFLGVNRSSVNRRCKEYNLL